MEGSKKNLFDVLSPAQTFVFGIVAGIMTLCSIGFFVLLGLMISGDGISLGSGSDSYVAAPSGPTAAAPAAAPREVKVTVDEKKDHIRGDKNAKVTVVEFSDPECPFCSRFHPTMQQVVADYDGDVRWVYKHFPLESIHPAARTIAIATECAAIQDKFWEFNDSVYENQGQYKTPDALKGLADELGLNARKFASCLDNKETDSVVQSHLSQATAAGCTGTPCSIVIDEDGNTTPINGAFPIDRVKSIIDPLVN